MLKRNEIDSGLGWAGSLRAACQPRADRAPRRLDPRAQRQTLKRALLWSWPFSPCTRTSSNLLKLSFYMFFQSLRWNANQWKFVRYISLPSKFLRRQRTHQCHWKYVRLEFPLVRLGSICLTQRSLKSHNFCHRWSSIYLTAPISELILTTFPKGKAETAYKLTSEISLCLLQATMHCINNVLKFPLATCSDQHSFADILFPNQFRVTFN